MAIVTLANGQQFDTDSKSVFVPAKKSQINGVVLYEGVSMLDYVSPIVVIATFNSGNVKTKGMIQTWIIRSDVKPQDAVKQGIDRAVCGDCPHRHHSGGACYVLPFQAPRSVYNSYKKGNYPYYEADKHSDLFKGKSMRLGSYGDPAAAPFDVWQSVAKLANNVTGYTHQFNHINFDVNLLEYCMVSCDTEKQANRLQKLGIKTFRVITENMTQINDEIACLSQTHGISCLDCGLCDGHKANVTVLVHGVKSKRFADKFERIAIKNI